MNSSQHFRFLTYFLFSLSAMLMFSASAHSKEAETLSPATIFIAGDSTAATYTNADHQGWGAMFSDFFNESKVRIDNRARGGRSTRRNW